MKTDRGWRAQAQVRLEELDTCSYPALCHLHGTPHRSLYTGGAGIAYVFWRAACRLQEPHWLHQARSWIDRVEASPEDERRMSTPDDPGQAIDIRVKDSFFLGNRGVVFAAALIANAEDNAEMLRQTRKAFCAPPAEPDDVEELFRGTAGQLVGSVLLLKETGEEPLRKHALTLARDLLATARPGAGGRPWPGNHRLGLAHGRAGNYYALLLCARETDLSLPDWIHAALCDFAASGRPQNRGVRWPVDERREGRFVDTWCNGAPGLIMLWSLAYEVYHDPLFLATARATGEYCVQRRAPRVGTLCCGAAGTCYAFLSLHRIDPGGPWLERAIEHAHLALQTPCDRYYRLSLYRGTAGLVCLLMDMEDPAEAAMPLLEG